MRPAVTRLGVNRPVLIGNMLRIEDATLIFQRIALGKIVADKSGINRAVDDWVRYMDALRPQFARHALGQCAQGELGAGEGRETHAAAQ